MQSVFHIGKSLQRIRKHIHNFDSKLRAAFRWLNIKNQEFFFKEKKRFIYLEGFIRDNVSKSTRLFEAFSLYCLLA